MNKIKTRSLISTLTDAGLIAIIVTITLFITASATAAPSEFNFKFQSLDPACETSFKLQKEWAEKLARDSQGRIKIKVLPVGDVVEYSDTWDAIKSGALQGHINSTSFFSDTDPAFGLMGDTVGAWSDPAQLLDYMYNGGGNEIMREIYRPYGLYYIGASTTGLESLVSKKPLNSVADLRGLKLRTPEGMVSQVFDAAGAKTVNLPAVYVFSALSRDVIDAADYKQLSTNRKAGLHYVAKHALYPGIHSLPSIEIAMSLQEWDKLPSDLQDLMRDSVKAYANTLLQTLEEENAKAIAEVTVKPGYMIHNWSDEERKKFRAIAHTQWEVVAGCSADAQKVYYSIIRYLKSKHLL